MKRIHGMRKISALVLACVLVASCLVGCGSSGSTSGNSASGGGETELLAKVLDSGKLTVVLNIGNAPWTYKDDATGEYTGMAVDLIKGYCAALDVECDIQPMEFQSLIPAITSGKADIICTNLSRTVARSASVMYTDSVGSDFGVVLCKKDKFASLDDVNQAAVTLTTEGGSIWESIAEDVFPNAKMSAVDTTPNAFAAVQAGRADCFITDLTIAKQLVATDPGMEIMDQYCYTDTMAFAVNNTYLSSSFVSSFNVYMRNIKSDGTYQELYKTYFDAEWTPVFTEIGV